MPPTLLQSVFLRVPFIQLQPNYSKLVSEKLLYYFIIFLLALKWANCESCCWCYQKKKKTVCTLTVCHLFFFRLDVDELRDRDGKSLCLSFKVRRTKHFRFVSLPNSIQAEAVSGQTVHIPYF